jgi:anti-sigma factor RsiW
MEEQAMECEDFEERVSALIDDECPEAELAGVFAHLGTCPSCLRFYRESMALRARLGRERIPAVRRSVDARILTHVIGRKIIRVPGWVRSRVPVPVPLAAAAVLLVLLGAWSILARIPAGGRAATDTEIVYVTTLPVVEVEAPAPGPGAERR